MHGGAADSGAPEGKRNGRFRHGLCGRVWLKEPAGAAVLVASTGAFLGVAIMVVGSLGDGSIEDDLLAFVMTACLALAIVLMRRWQQVSMLLAILVAIVLAVVASAPFAQPRAPNHRDFVLLALFGFSQMGLGWILFTIGVRFVPAAETALLGVLEVVLAPVWVWLAFNELPNGATFFGGGLVLAAVLGHVTYDLIRWSSAGYRGAA
jgi:drug/metabolite transporter (DMT)-like permease